MAGDAARSRRRAHHALSPRRPTRLVRSPKRTATSTSRSASAKAHSASLTGATSGAWSSSRSSEDPFPRETRRRPLKPNYSAHSRPSPRNPRCPKAMPARPIESRRIGNIYSNEAMWLARLKPMRRANSLTAPEAARLHKSIGTVLRRALECCLHPAPNFRDPNWWFQGIEDVLAVMVARVAVQTARRYRATHRARRPLYFLV